MKTFVLLHGGMLGGWCWQEVAKLLRAKGNRVYTPTFTGMGERAHLLSPEINHTIHVQDILNVIYYESLTEVVLVGHSYAGVILSCVASSIPEKISKIIHIDTFIPVPHQSYFSAGPVAFMELFEKLAQEKGDGWKLMPDKIFLERWGVAEQSFADELFNKLTPIPISLFRKPIIFNEEIVAKIHHTFISCSKTTKVRQPAYEQALAKGWTVFTLEASHLAMLTEPKKLARIL